MNQVAIVGGGISSMYAILACNTLGITPDVYVKDFNIQPGAVYLRHVPSISEMNLKTHTVRTIPSGTREAYILKQWSTYPIEYSSSFPEAQFDSEVYSPREVMKWIMENGKGEILKCGKLEDRDLENLSEQYEFVFHSFPSSISMEFLQSYMVKIPVISYEESENLNNVVSYDGHAGSIFTILFGTKYMEITPRCYFERSELVKLFPGANVNLISDLSPWTPKNAVSNISKNIIPIGRLATGNRSDLAEDVFKNVVEILHENL
jgi:hypothetical protein